MGFQNDLKQHNAYSNKACPKLNAKFCCVSPERRSALALTLEKRVFIDFQISLVFLKLLKGKTV